MASQGHDGHLGLYDRYSQDNPFFHMPGDVVLTGRDHLEK